MKNKEIAFRISQIMQQAGFTQKTLADYLGISQPAVSQYLRGRIPPADILYQLAQLGQTTMEWVLTGQKGTPLLQGKVRERPATYGGQIILMKLWDQLPTNLQRDILILMRHLIETINRSSKTAVSARKG